MTLFTSEPKLLITTSPSGAQKHSVTATTPLPQLCHPSHPEGRWKVVVPHGHDGI